MIFWPDLIHAFVVSCSVWCGVLCLLWVFFDMLAVLCWITFISWMFWTTDSWRKLKCNCIGNTFGVIDLVQGRCKPLARWSFRSYICGWFKVRPLVQLRIRTNVTKERWILLLKRCGWLVGGKITLLYRKKAQAWSRFRGQLQRP